MLFDPADLSQGSADSVYDSLKDDHEAIEDSGVASGYAPPTYEAQFGEIWVRIFFSNRIRELRLTSVFCRTLECSFEICGELTHRKSRCQKLFSVLH